MHRNFTSKKNLQKWEIKMEQQKNKAKGKLARFQHTLPSFMHLHFLIRHLIVHPGG